MDKMEAIDDYTVRMTIPEGGLGVGQLRRALTPYWQSMGIHSKKLFDEVGADGMVDKFIGTGPLVFQEWKQDDKATLEALDNHWRKTAPMKTDTSNTAVNGWSVAGNLAADNSDNRQSSIMTLQCLLWHK